MKNLFIVLIIIGIIAFVKWFIYDRDFYLSLRKESDTNDCNNNHKKKYSWNEKTRTFDDKEDN